MPIFFIDSLPEEARGKCALCIETLTHIVKQAEATIKAGTATVTRMLAEKINETAAPQDRVSGEALRSRIIQKENGRESICRNPTLNDGRDKNGISDNKVKWGNSPLNDREKNRICSNGTLNCTTNPSPPPSPQREDRQRIIAELPPQPPHIEAISNGHYDFDEDGK